MTLIIQPTMQLNGQTSLKQSLGAGPNLPHQGVAINLSHLIWPLLSQHRAQNGILCIYLSPTTWCKLSFQAHCYQKSYQLKSITQFTVMMSQIFTNCHTYSYGTDQDRLHQPTTSWKLQALQKVFCCFETAVTVHGFIYTSD